MVQCCKCHKYDSVNERTLINEITYSRSVAKCPQNLLGNWKVTDDQTQRNRERRTHKLSQNPNLPQTNPSWEIEANAQKNHKYQHRQAIGHL